MERFNGIAGQVIDLYFYSKSAAGVLQDLYSVGPVYIYPYHPVDNWAANIVVNSAFGRVPTVTTMKSLVDTSVSFLNLGVSVGNYIEIAAGANVGKYKILAVYEHELQVETAFTAAVVNLSYAVTTLRGIFNPQRINQGTYKVSWTIPLDESGGYYYDKWTDIMKSQIASPYDEVKTMYISKDLPFFMSTNYATVTNRYTARPGARAYLDMKFRDQPTWSARDPYQISEVALFRFDPRYGAVAPAASSATGTCDQGDPYLLRDVGVDFAHLANPVRKYDTLTITSPAQLAGKYRIDLVDTIVDPYGHALRLLDALPAYAAIVTFTIDYKYWCSLDNISKVDVGEFMLDLPIPADFLAGSYWDEWKYIPDAQPMPVSFAIDYATSGDYTRSNPSLIEISGGNLRLTDLGAGVYSKLKPYAYLTVPNVLSYPQALTGLAEIRGPGNTGVVEYSLQYGGVDFWFNGVEWVANSGRFQLGDPNWNSIASVWRMEEDWNDSKRTNDGVRHGSGPEFSGSDRGLFNGTDDYVSVPENSVFANSFGNGFSIHARLYPGQSAEQVFAMKAYSAAVTGGGPGWAAILDATGHVALRLGYGAQGSNLVESVSTGAIPGDANIHSVLITIGASESQFANRGDVIIYIDGVLDKTFTAAGLPYIFFDNPYPLMIGAGYNAGGTPNLFYKGEMSDLAIISGVLTAEDARRIHADFTNNKHSNTLAIVSQNVNKFVSQDGDSIGIIAYMVSDGSQPVVLSENSILWNQSTALPSSRAVGEVTITDRLFSMAPGPIDLCSIVGRVVDINGQPVKDATIEMYGVNGAPLSAAGNIVLPGVKTFMTDVGGYFQIPAPQGAQCWLSIPSLNYRKRVNVPMATRVNWLDLREENA